ncbi:MAG: 1,4-alpha-glucan branching protein domain-containing protein [Anaerolineae bacterium]
MGSLGSFSFVLHTHLPYCRHAGVWPHGEEWLYEAASETYVPLLELLLDLQQRLLFSLTMSLTPVLAEQLAATEVLDGIRDYMVDRGARASRDIARFEAAGDAPMAALAGRYSQWYGERVRAFDEDLGSDIVGTIARLRGAGAIEVITSAATHGYLPLLSRDSSVYGQVHTGVESYRRSFADAPAGFWLPECAYRPAVVDADGVTRPPLEEFLANEGLRFFFVESHAIEGGMPPTSTGHLVPWYAGANRLITPVAERPGGEYTTAYPYYVGRSPVAAIGRNRTLSMQVWSAAGGYPGDPSYREFHKRDDVSGMQYWAITGRDVDLGAKLPYDPDEAARRVTEHARHFAGVVIAELERLSLRNRRPPLITAVFDTELFGHWWFEGVAWLGRVLELLAQDGRVTLEPIASYLDRNPPESAIDVPESSWGAAGDHRTWLNPSTEQMWQDIHGFEQEMEQLLRQAPADRRRILQQAARELVLIESSDWPFLVTTGQAREYAVERFRAHSERFRLLTRLALAPTIDSHEQQYLAEVEHDDSLFDDIEPAWFAARQGRTT